MRSACVILLGIWLSGCATLPSDRPARGLYRDLRQAVDFRTGAGWVVDDLEVGEITPSVMRSLCSTPPSASQSLQAWLAAELERQGGPSEAQFEARAGMTGEVRSARRIERVQALLEAAEEKRGDCPYWIEASDDFAGVQGNEGRFSVWLESGGGGSLAWDSSGFELGGGGAGRIMPAVGLGQRLSLAVGAGLGGSGFLPEVEDGTREFRGVLSTIVPLVIRVTDVGRIYDVEFALSTRFAGSDVYHGGRVSFGIGLTTPRVAGLMPYALLWTGYEYSPAQNGALEQHSLWLGTRVGFDWYPQTN